MMKNNISVHDGCPNRYHCKKDEKQCCYLMKNNTCYLDTEKAGDFL